MSRFIFLTTVACITILFACNSAPLPPENVLATATPIIPTLTAFIIATPPPATANIEPTVEPSSTSSPIPTITATPTPAFPPFTGDRPIDRNKIGIQVHPFGENQEMIMQNLEALGVGWVKIQISWKLFQPDIDRLDDFWFTEADRLINGANDQDIKVLVSIAKAPE
jgi:hypothetical protein